MAKWVYRPGHPKANERGFVAWEDMGHAPEAEAKDAPVMPGRIYDHLRAQDGTDISSRSRYKEYMKQNNLTHTSDFAGDWEKAKAQREAIQKGEHDKKERKEQVERAFYERFKP